MLLLGTCVDEVLDVHGEHGRAAETHRKKPSHSHTCIPEGQIRYENKNADGLSGVALGSCCFSCDGGPLTTAGRHFVSCAGTGKPAELQVNQGAFKITGRCEQR